MDNYFRSWFRFVYPNRSLLERGEVTQAHRQVEGQLDQFVAPTLRVEPLRGKTSRPSVGSTSGDFTKTGSWTSPCGRWRVGGSARRRLTPLWWAMRISRWGSVTGRPARWARTSLTTSSARHTRSSSRGVGAISTMPSSLVPVSPPPWKSGHRTKACYWSIWHLSCCRQSETKETTVESGIPVVAIVPIADYERLITPEVLPDEVARVVVTSTREELARRNLLAFLEKVHAKTPEVEEEKGIRRAARAVRDAR